MNFAGPAPCSASAAKEDFQTKGLIMKIGISGASGHAGKAVLAHLRERVQSAAQIVAISRTPATVAGLGVEARFGDYDRPETLAAAYQGLDKLLIIPTADMREGVRAKQNLTAIDAAVAAAVGDIVFLSSAGTRRLEETNLFASYFAAEQRLQQIAPAWTILRMNYYAEALLDEAQMSLAHGALAGLDENRVAFIARDDVAAAAAGILATNGHSGAIYSATGPASLSGAERAAIIAAAAGKTLSFLVTPEAQLRAGLTQAALPAGIVEAFVNIQTAFAEGVFDIVTGDVARLSGRPPRPLKEVVTQWARAA
jgi:NAD(P)H dehydrogenase (quinone)